MRLERGFRRPRRRRSVNEQQKRLTTLIERFSSGTINVATFLRSLGYAFSRLGDAATDGSSADQLLSVDQSTVGQPTVDQRTMDQRTVDQPTVDQSAVDQPTAVQPTVDQPTVDQSGQSPVVNIAPVACKLRNRRKSSVKRHA